MLHDLLSDVRFALRAMRANPVFTLVIILTLAIGLGANTAMFSVLHAALFEALPYKDPQRLVMGQTTFSGRPNPSGSAYDYYDYREQADVFDSLAAITSFPIEVTVTAGQEPVRAPAALVSSDLFQTLGVNPVGGRHFLPEEGEPGAPGAVIVSHSFWQQQLGGARDAVGTSLILNGAVPRTVVGVMPQGFRFLWDADIWVPMSRNGPYAGARRFHNWLMIGRLKPDVSLRRAQEQVDVISARLEQQYPDSNTSKALRLVGLQDAIVEGDTPRLLLLMVAVAAVLLITCGNVAGLLLARGSARRGEIAIRAALGAPRLRLIRQFLTESIVLALAGGALGVVLAGWLQRALPSLVRLDRLGLTEVGVSVPVALFAAAITLLTGILFGIAPALHAASGTPLVGLTAGARAVGTRGGTRLRSALVVAQVALSLALLVSSGLLVRSFVGLNRTDPGFDARNLLTAEIQLPGREYPDAERIIPFFRRLRDEVRGMPGVTDVAFISQLPLRNPGNNISVWAAERPPARPSDRGLAFTRQIMPGYFEAMGIPLRAGRGIAETDVQGSPPVLVINQLMADTLFPGGRALGQRVMVDMGGDEPVSFEVVGIVADARLSSIAATPRMAMYHSFYQFTGSTMRLAIRTAVEPATITTALRERVWKLDRQVPVEHVLSMDAVVADSLAPRRLVSLTLGLFAGVAVLLAAIGLYGVLAYWVVQRRREIGIRVALGAGTAGVVRLVAWRGILLAGAGVAIGLAGAFAGTRLIEEQLYQVEATDPATYLAMSGLFVVVAAAASLLPAWRAARIDPIVALRVD